MAGVLHKRLKVRLKQCVEWDEFIGYSTTEKLLGGFGNVEDNQLFFPDQTFRAIALRSFNPTTDRWSIWWLDGRFPDAIDVPVVGQFNNGVGSFFADDVLAGQPIKVRFLWALPSPNKPRWEQAFSVDEGITWETNWVMDFEPHNA